MDTKREPNSVWFFPAVWSGILVRNWDKGLVYRSYDEVPHLLRERAAVLRLLEEGEESPLGMWQWDRKRMDHDYHIVRQPGDPPWEEW